MGLQLTKIAKGSKRSLLLLYMQNQLLYNNRTDCITDRKRSIATKNAMKEQTLQRFCL